MLRFKEITLKPFWPGYGKGSRPGYTCSVELQHGAYSHEAVTIDLDPEAVREVIACAVAKAVEKLTLDPTTIDVEGNPGVPREEDLPAPAPSAPEPIDPESEVQF